MIYETDQQPKEGEVKCYTVAIGNAPMPWQSRKVKESAKEALQFIQKLEGFAGFHPVPPRGTLCIFKTLNNAKAAKNQMDAKGIQTGNNICEVFIEKKYIQQEGDKNG